jgi:glycosyltransferase involved in cell wall biosynthesis
MAKYHEVTVLTFGEPENRYDFQNDFDGKLKATHFVGQPFARRFRRLTQFYSLWTSRSFFRMSADSNKMQKKINQLLDKNTYDIIHTEFAHMGLFNFQTNALKVLDTHNIEYEIFQRMSQTVKSPIRRLHYKHEYEYFMAEEIEAYKKQNAIFTTSQRDKDIITNHVPEIQKFVVPNGVDTSYFYPTDEPVEPYSMVFTGMMGYLPNSDGILYFLDEIFPLVLKKISTAKIYIVGQLPPKALLARASDNIVVTGFVPDVRPYISRSAVYVVPLRMGSGTRLKIFEAFAMRKPIVTTSIGCEGIEVKHGESALIADDPYTFAEQIIQLMNDAKLQRNLVHCGYELVRTRYDWKEIGLKMEDFYKIILNKK